LLDQVVARLRAAGCVYAEDEARLLAEAASGPGALDRLVEERVRGVPLEQLLGWAEFAGLRITVGPNVFVPRRRTELLVRLATAHLEPGRRTVVDLCCGTGAVGAAIVAARPDVDLHAVDLDPEAVRCARVNVRGHVYEGDLTGPLPARLKGAVDVLVANAPYVPTKAIAFMPPEARLYEPAVALDGGPDGLDIARRVVAAAPRWLAGGGLLLIETSERQAPELLRAAIEAGLTARIERDDDLDATALAATPG
jgi:release factor glutamine methyltransferase